MFGGQGHSLGSPGPAPALAPAPAAPPVDLGNALSALLAGDAPSSGAASDDDNPYEYSDDDAMPSDDDDGGFQPKYHLHPRLGV